MESIRSALRPLAARLKTARTLPQRKMTRYPSQPITAQGCRKPPQRNAASSHPQKPAPCSIQNVARYRMHIPQMESIRSALRPLAAPLKNSADTAAAQDDAMPIANDNGARMPQASRRNLPHLIPEKRSRQRGPQSPRTAYSLQHSI